MVVLERLRNCIALFMLGMYDRTLFPVPDFPQIVRKYEDTMALTFHTESRWGGKRSTTHGKMSL